MRIILEDEIISLETLRDFVVEGKKNGWASGRAPTHRQNGREVYAFERRISDEPLGNRLVYEDSFIGTPEGGFVGQEAIYLQPKPNKSRIPLWGMNYSDKFELPENFPRQEEKSFKKKVMRFLKDCLLQVPENFPFRGPVGQVKRDIMGREITYVNTPLAMIDHHSRIYVGGDFIFRDFHGFESLIMESPEVKSKESGVIFSLSYHGRLLVPVHTNSI
jgi:hypothetical protein